MTILDLEFLIKKMSAKIACKTKNSFTKELEILITKMFKINIAIISINCNNLLCYTFVI